MSYLRCKTVLYRADYSNIGVHIQCYKMFIFQNNPETHTFMINFFNEYLLKCFKYHARQNKHIF